MVRGIEKELLNNQEKQIYNFNDLYFLNNDLIHSSINIRKMLGEINNNELRMDFLRCIYIYCK